MQVGNPKWRYKDLENRRHAGLGQEAARASIRTGGTRTSKSAETRGSQKQEASGLRNDEGTWSLKIKGFLRNEGLCLASAIMPDTKTQAEGTPCSLVLQPNSVKGVGIYIRKNSEQNFCRCVYDKYMSRGKAGMPYLPARSIL